MPFAGAPTGAWTCSSPSSSERSLPLKSDPEEEAVLEPAAAAATDWAGRIAAATATEPEGGGAETGTRELNGSV